MREEDDKLLKWLGEVEPCNDHRSCHCTYEMMEMSKEINTLIAIIHKLRESNEFYANRMGSGGTARQARKEVLEMIDERD